MIEGLGPLFARALEGFAQRDPFRAKKLSERMAAGQATPVVRLVLSPLSYTIDMVDYIDVTTTKIYGADASPLSEDYN